MSLLFAVTSLPVQAEDSRVFIHPGRETFVYFPSVSLGSAYTVTFFLPEDHVPLSRNYPVVVALGVTPKQAKEAAALTRRGPAIVVGINFEEKDYVQRAAQIQKFLSQELLPYIDSNYWTLAAPQHRILAANGKSAVRVALRVAQNPSLYGALALFSPADVWEDAPVPAVRTLVNGTQAELAVAQQFFEKNGKTYGVDFALRYGTPTDTWFNEIDTAYLWAPAQAVSLKRLEAALTKKVLPLDKTEKVFLRAWAVLENDSFFHYIPSQLRVSPPYVLWDPLTGSLNALPGAQPGKVRLSNFVDNPAFSIKLELKKQ